MGRYLKGSYIRKEDTGLQPNKISMTASNLHQHKLLDPQALPQYEATARNFGLLVCDEGHKMSRITWC